MIDFLEFIERAAELDQIATSAEMVEQIGHVIRRYDDTPSNIGELILYIDAAHTKGVSWNDIGKAISEAEKS